MDKENVINGIVKMLEELSGKALEDIHNDLSDDYKVHYLGDDWFELTSILEAKIE